MVARAGDVSCHRIQRLVLTCKPVCAAGVYQPETACLEVTCSQHFVQFFRADDPGGVGSSVAMLCDGDRRLGAYGKPFLLPRGEAAVEYSDLAVTEPLEQPPKSGGVGAVALIVRNDRRIQVDSQTSERSSECLG